MSDPSGSPARRDERGSTLPLIIGFAGMVMLLVAVVVDATAVYLRRDNLDTLADGAALQGADLGVQGTEVYAGPGLGGERLQVTESAVRASVRDYLHDTGAYERYPGLSFGVRVDADAHRVEVRVASPVELPLGVPGLATRTTVRASGSASVLIDP